MSILQDLLTLKQSTETVVESHDDDMDPQEARDLVDELNELHDEMVKKMSEVRSIVRRLPRHIRGQAESYWIPHIMIALGGDHEWMTAGHESTMQKSIEELQEYSHETGEDDDDVRHPDEQRADPMGHHHGRNY